MFSQTLGSQLHHVGPRFSAYESLFPVSILALPQPLNNYFFSYIITCSSSH